MAKHEAVLETSLLSEIFQSNQSFFAPDCKVELRIGGAFEMYFDLEAGKGKMGSEGAKILAIQKPTMLSFTWNAPPHLPSIRKQWTHVLIKLHKSGPKKTLVQLCHDGWGTGDQWKKASHYFQRAWLELVLPRLKQRFSSGPLNWDEIT